MSTIGSSLFKGEDGTGLINPSVLNQIAGLPKDLTRSAFDAAVTQERANIINNGTGIWANGEKVSIFGETGTRIWFVGASASLSHARTVSYLGKVYALAADANVFGPTSGAPASGTGANGDFSVDGAAGLVYGPKASGAWPAGVSSGVQGAPGAAGATGPTGASGTGTGTVNTGTTGQLAAYLAGGTALSGVTIGSGLTLSGGTLTAPGGTTYTLPVATPSTLGGVKQGSGVTIAGDGTIAATGITGISINGTTIVASTGSPYQMATADRLVDVSKTTGAATGILLPTAPTLWVDYLVIDGKGDAATNNITISVAGGTINGASTFVMNANNDAITARAVSATTWRIT